MTDDRCILAINAGSSSIKFAVFNTDIERRLHGELEGLGTRPHLMASLADGTEIIDCNWGAEASADSHSLIQQLVHWLDEQLGAGKLAAIGHRVAIGGLEHTGPVLVTPELLSKLRALIPLAPMHQPRNLEPIDALGISHPGIPQVACFDTAFHRTMPRVAELYGLPRSLMEAGAHRYGFHGLSYEYIASRLLEIDPHAASGRTVVAHLGSGASLCALQGRQSIATTMGFSPLSGLVMGTRPGDIDPGLMIWLLREQGMSVDQVEQMLYREAGLKGVSGISNDMRDLLASDAPNAREAVELFVYRISTELGALAAALAGLDALVFTAGIGENAPEIRHAVCKRAAWLGVRLSDAADRQHASKISADNSAISVHVIPTDEEQMVAQHTANLTLNPI